MLLLDEPLSALDVKLRKQMQIELKAIQHQLGTTFVYVTHDQEEALLMSDRIGIMNHGRLLQVGTPREIYEKPADAFVADFVGSLNAFELRVDEVSEGRARMRPAEGQQVDVGLEGAGATVGSTLRVAIRPERVSVRSVDAAGGAPLGSGSRLGGVVGAVDYVGPLTTYRVDTDLGALAVQEANDTSGPAFEVGDRVILEWAADAAFVLPESSTESPPA